MRTPPGSASRAVIATTLNSSPIWSGADQALERELRLLRRGPGSPAPALARASMPSRASQSPCATTGVTLSAGFLRCCGSDSLEIDMRGQVVLARILERIGRSAWPRTACSVSPVPGLHSHSRSSSATPPLLDQLSRRSAVDRGVQRARRESRMTSPSRSNGETVRPAIVMRRSVPLDQLPDRQRVEEFVGDDDQRPSRQTRRSMSCHCASGNGLACACAQDRTGLDEMDAAAQSRPGHRAQRIGGERAAARAELDTSARPDGSPARSHRSASTGPDQLAEHLADLGRGGEVARRAERIARRVIMRVAAAMIRCDAGSAPRRRSAREARVRAGTSRDARGARHRLDRGPAPLRGQHQIEAAAGSSAATATGPCAGPVACANWTSWLSGSRKNSTTKRNRP